MDQQQLDPKKLAAYRLSKLKKTLRSTKLSAALICYYYPQYTLQEALDLEYGDTGLLLKVAMRQEIQRSLINLEANAYASSAKSFKSHHRSLTKEINKIDDDL